jgi:NAD(P)-dependent dehydrogenase (short-subunit alcohol dehydrogenase family)
MLDVEDGASIVAAATQIESQLSGRGLDGLVNVAGIGLVRPIEYAVLRDVRQIFEVNVFGQIAITRAFSRLLREQRGRIVNITSIGVNIAIPFAGLLNASKSAFGMLSDTMRLELHPFGIRVCTVEPGAIATPAVDKTLGDIEQVVEDLPADAQAQYGPMLRNFARRAYAMEKSGSSPDVVARAVHHALTSSRPRIRYRVGKHAKLLTTLPKILPESILDAIRLRMFGLAAPAAAGQAGERNVAPPTRARAG